MARKQGERNQYLQVKLHLYWTCELFSLVVMSGRICSPFSEHVSSSPVGAGGVPVISSSAKGAPVMSSFTVVDSDQPRKLSEVVSDEEQSFEDSGSGSREESSEKEGTSEGESGSESREGKPQRASQEVS